MEKLSFRLPVFEGPLDALLYLISKNKLDIYDISISELLDQYLAYLAALNEMDLELTSDFLEMASRLVQIKSAMLLPKPEGGEAQRDELIATLIGYQTCKAMAYELQLRNGGMNTFVRQPQPVPHRENYTVTHEADELLKAYIALGNRIKGKRPPTTEAFRGVIGHRVVSVAARIVHVIRQLFKEGQKSFDSMFDDAADRSEAVATFLAVLELVKSKKITVADDDGKTVRIRRQSK